jgi:hypothetical protein
VTLDGVAQTGCPRLWPAPSARPALGRARDPAWSFPAGPWQGTQTGTQAQVQVAGPGPAGRGGCLLSAHSESRSAKWDSGQAALQVRVGVRIYIGRDSTGTLFTGLKKAYSPVHRCEPKPREVAGVLSAPGSLCPRAASG